MLRRASAITTVMAFGIALLCTGFIGEASAQDGSQMPQSFGEALARAFLGGKPQPGSQPVQSNPSQTTPGVSVPRGGGNLSEAFYRNQAAGISYYSSWQAANVQFSSIAFIDGQYRVSWRELPTSYQAENANRQARMNQSFSWNDWNAVSSNPPAENTWTIVCLFPSEAGTALSAIQRGAMQSVRVKIKSAVERQLVFDCRM